MALPVDPIVTEDYSVTYDEASATAILKGSLRLDGVDAYRPIADLLLAALDRQSATFTLDVRELEFLNSSGISTLLSFVVKVRERGNVAMVLLGSQKILWQTKSLRNLQRLMPSIDLRFS